MDCALDDEGCLIAAPFAHPKIDYRCIECGRAMRLRDDGWKRPHFFHITGGCGGGRGPEHLQIQLRLQKNIGKGRLHFEHSFDQIHRRADAYWPEQRIVFEVQCSPLGANELLERHNDYAQIGIHCVWILHMNQFGLRRPKDLDRALVHITHYYTDIDVKGHGRIFDGLALFHGNIFSHGHVDLAAPVKRTCHKHFWPRTLHKRRWSIFFRGDLFDSFYERRKRFETWYARFRTYWWKDASNTSLRTLFTFVCGFFRKAEKRASCLKSRPVFRDF